MKLKKIAASIAAMAFAAGVVAKENDVGIFGTSGKGMGDHTFIAQDGPKADNIRNILKNVKMPAGFKIELYAIVPDARDMAMAPQGTVLFVGTRMTRSGSSLTATVTVSLTRLKTSRPHSSLTYRTVSNSRKMDSYTSLSGTMSESSQRLSAFTKDQTSSRLTSCQRAS